MGPARWMRRARQRALSYLEGVERRRSGGEPQELEEREKDREGWASGRCGEMRRR